MLKSLFQKNYIFYGGSIVISRGLEYFVLFFAAGYLTKESYGELEYYKKFIEVGSSVLAFGFPALILSYTRSVESKRYFYLLSLIFVLILGSISAFIGIFLQDWIMLLPALVFYALFFTGGITQSYQLVQNGSKNASVYKLIISILFYSILFLLICFFNVKGMGYVYPSYILLPIALIYTYKDFYGKNIQRRKVKKYWKLFRKLLFSSFTLVISNFANIMFLYVDILIIKLFSKNTNNEIADFSFALNIASILFIVSLTMVQVNIETLKKDKNYVYILHKKVLYSTIALSIFLIVLYISLISSPYFINYKNTFILFLIILVGKIMASISGPFGSHLAILKGFSINLYINVIVLICNLGLCFITYHFGGLIALAFTSSIMLGIRFILFAIYNKKMINKTNLKQEKIKIV